jgi:hypothetical protein
MIRYEYFDSGNFLIYKYIDHIKKDHIISFIEFIYTKTDARNLTKIISDFRDSIIDFDDDALIEIAQARAYFSKGFKVTQTSYLVGNSKDTMITTLVSFLYGKQIPNVSVCSTIGCCIKNLNINFTPEEVHNMITNLKYAFIN